MQNKLSLKYPASWWGAKWREALPSGNGVVGAAVYGAVHDETVLLTHDDLWHEVVTPELPDVSHRLPEVRRLLLENKAELADRVLSDALKAAGYHPDIGAPLPVGDLKVRTPVGVGFSAYRRELDMATGEILVRWNDGETVFQRRLFVSRADDCVVMELGAEGPEGLSADILLDIHDRADAVEPGGNGPALPGHVEVEVEAGGIIRYAARNDDGTDFGVVARVYPRTGAITPLDDGIRFEGNDPVLVVLKIFVRGERHRDWARLGAELAAWEPDYRSLLERHVARHGELFNRVRLDLKTGESASRLSNEELLLAAYQGEAPTVMIEKMWAYGRYLLISSSREGSHPCPLQGKWCGSYRGYWTFNMANENLQMNYWQAMSGNLPEVALPVFDYVERMMDDFRENAQKLYGCRGILITPITTPPSGLIKDIQPHILHWTGAAAWIGQHYYDYYLHTNDRVFLAERVVPYLREVALFYEDFFTLGDDGYFVSAPSNSPENSPGNYARGATDLVAMETTMNATMDFALAKEVLTHLVEASDVLGMGGREVDTWRAMLTRIPPYQVNDSGAVSEWMHPFYEDNDHHRHQSHIYPVFPGTEVTPESDPEIYRAFQVAIQNRLVVGIGSQTGWSLAHMANVYARMKNGDQALACLNLLARSSVMNNFYTTHNDWRDSGIGVDFAMAPFQIDANMGWSAAVQEMLLFSVPGRISVLPALPGAWARGEVQGLLARGHVEVSIRWETEREFVEIKLFSPSEDQRIELCLPYGPNPAVTVDLKAGRSQTVTTGSNKEPIR